MTSDLCFVLDTGVVVSAVLLPRSVPRQAVDRAFARGMVLAKDDKFLELAVSGNATCIASGDNDLLVLNPFRGVAIMTP